MHLKINSIGADRATREILERLGMDGGCEGVELVTEGRERPGLSVSREGDRLVIASSERAYFFRALGLAAEHEAEESFRLEEDAAFEGNGMMADCSRNAVLNLDTGKELIRTLALMGHNTLMLYTEDTYEVEGEPYFGYMRGRYNREELRELDAYAAEFGVEMVPCIQTLAHLNAALRWNAYAELRDIDDILLADYEPTYALIEKMIKSCREAFRTKRIHIGMDEAANLGLGRHRKLFGESKGIDIMYRHLERVMDICRRYGFQPMMWGDMFFALTGQDYHSEEGVDASQLKQVPEDLSLIYWDYYADRRETYEFNLRQMGKLSPELTFAGGSWKWSGYAPEMLHSLKVSRLALSACRQFGVKRVFATAWGDNGGDASIYAALPGIQLFAELGFHENVTEEELASRFAVCTGGRLEDFLRLDLPNLPDGQPKSLGFNPAKYLFFQDPMVGLFDRHAALGFDAFYRDTAAALHEAAERAGRYAHVFRVLEAMCSALALKATVGIRLKQAYEADDRQELLRLAEEVLPEIARREETFRDCVETQWMAENKPFGFEVQDIRIAGAVTRARSAAKRVKAYLDGELKALEELEEERLYFDCRQEPGVSLATGCNWWHYEVSASVVAAN